MDSWHNCCECIRVSILVKRLGFEGVKSQKASKEPNIVVLYTTEKDCTADGTMEFQ